MEQMWKCRRTPCDLLQRQPSPRRQQRGMLAPVHTRTHQVQTQRKLDASRSREAHQVQQILLRAKVCVDLLKVSSPVTMVSIGRVLHNRRDPNRVETHRRDVLQLVRDSLPCATTVVI